MKEEEVAKRRPLLVEVRTAYVTGTRRIWQKKVTALPTLFEAESLRDETKPTPCPCTSSASRRLAGREKAGKRCLCTRQV